MRGCFDGRLAAAVKPGPAECFGLRGMSESEMVGCVGFPEMGVVSAAAKRKMHSEG